MYVCVCVCVYIYKHTHIYSFHYIPVSVGQKDETAISDACKDILLSAISLPVPEF